MRKQYFMDRLSYIILLLLPIGIFGILSYLYQMPLDGVLYGGILCIFLFALLGVVDFYRYTKKRERLRYLSAETFVASNLPVSKSNLEKQYQDLLCSFHKLYSSLLTTDQLQSQEMKDFYALWVHQIKTPIAALSLLLQEDESVKNREMQMELFKIEQYVDLVLNYLKVEDLSSDFVFQSCDLERIVRQSVKKFATVFISKKIKIELENLNHKVVSDEKWLCFAIDQVLSNALKYTEKAGTIRIFLGDADSLIIEDTGIGIMPEDLSRIFEKGYTGYNGRMDKKATGIGLYLTKKALDRMGHEIHIQSNGKSGTKVVISTFQEKIEFE